MRRRHIANHTTVYTAPRMAAALESQGLTQHVSLPHQQVTTMMACKRAIRDIFRVSKRVTLRMPLVALLQAAMVVTCWSARLTCCASRELRNSAD